MEASLEDSCDGGDLVQEAYEYVATSKYPVGCTDNRKRVIRKKAKKFEVKEGEPYYKKTVKGKVSRMRIL